MILSLFVKYFTDFHQKHNSFSEANNMFAMLIQYMLLIVTETVMFLAEIRTIPDKRPKSIRRE
jgi:hypothetical protein